jgi:hypothetical protein
MAPATVTVVYPQGVKFNMDYYKSTHMPLVQKKWGSYGLNSCKQALSHTATGLPY